MVVGAAHYGRLILEGNSQIVMLLDLVARLNGLPNVRVVLYFTLECAFGSLFLPSR